MLLGYDHVRAALLAQPEATFAVMRNLADKLREANALAEIRAPQDSATRLVRLLARLAERWGDNDAGAVRLRKRFSQGMLGEMAGLARESVNRRLQAWWREGLLGRDADHLVLKDMPALDILAGGAEDAHKPDGTSGV